MISQRKPLTSKFSGNTLVQAIRERFLASYYDVVWLIPINVIWTITSLLLITLPPAVVALFYITNRYHADRSTGWREFFTGFRQYFWLSYLWAGTAAAVYAVLVVNLNFYSGQAEGFSGILAGLMVAGIAVWTLIQFMVLPVLFEQEHPQLRLAYRNVWVLLVAHTEQFIVLFLGVTLMTTVSLFFVPAAWAVITMSAGAYLANRQVCRAIAVYRRTP